MLFFVYHKSLSASNLSIFPYTREKYIAELFLVFFIMYHVLRCNLHTDTSTLALKVAYVFFHSAGQHLPESMLQSPKNVANTVSFLL